MKRGIDSKILRYLGLPLLAATLLCSCTEELASETGPGGGNAAGEQKVTIHLQVPGSSEGKKETTRAVGNNDVEITKSESTVEDLYIMAFDHNDGFAYYRKAKKKNDQGDWEADLKLGKEKQTLVFAANVDGSEGEGGGKLSETIAGLTQGTPKETALSTLEVSLTAAEVTGGFNAQSSNNHRPFTMYGQLSTDNPHITPGKWTVQLHRIMGRIQLQFGEKDPITGTLPGIAGFVPKKVYLYNTNNKARVTPANLTVDTEKDQYTTTPSIPAGATLSRGPIEYTIPEGKNELVGEIYLFETAQPNTQYVDDKNVHQGRTCLVVGGLYDGATDLSYYRVDLAAQTDKNDPTTREYKHVLRNHTYNITVTDVRVRGYASAKDAFEATSSGLQTDLIVWNDGKIGNIDFIGDQFLGLGTMEYKVSKNAATIKQAVTASKDLEWSAVLLNEDGTGRPDWITFKQTSNNMLGPISGTEQAEEYELEVEEYAQQTGERRAIMRFTAGMLKLDAVVTQDYNNALFIKVAKSEEPDKEITELEFTETGGKGHELTISLAPEFTTLNWVINKDANSGLNVINATVNGSNVTEGRGEVQLHAGGAKNEVRWTGTVTEALADAEWGMNEASLTLTGTTANGTTATKTITLKQLKYGVSIDTDMLWLGNQTTPVKVTGNIAWRVESEDETGDDSSIQCLIRTLTDTEGEPADDFATAPSVKIETGAPNLGRERKKYITLTFTDRNNEQRKIVKTIKVRGAWRYNGGKYAVYPRQVTYTPGSSGYITDPNDPLYQERLTNYDEQGNLNYDLATLNDPEFPQGYICRESTYEDPIAEGGTIEVSIDDGSAESWDYKANIDLLQTVVNCPCNTCRYADRRHKYETKIGYVGPDGWPEGEHRLQWASSSIEVDVPGKTWQLKRWCYSAYSEPAKVEDTGINTAWGVEADNCYKYKQQIGRTYIGTLNEITKASNIYFDNWQCPSGNVRRVHFSFTVEGPLPDQLRDKLFQGYYIVRLN